MGPLSEQIQFIDDDDEFWLLLTAARYGEDGE